MELREGSGEWGNYTQADSICFSSVLKHPPPLEHSYFRAAAFSYEGPRGGGGGGGEELYLSHRLLILKDHIYIYIYIPAGCL